MSAQLGGGTPAKSFSFALGRLDPVDFDMVWNQWELHQALVWIKLQNIDQAEDDHRRMMSKTQLQHSKSI